MQPVRLFSLKTCRWRRKSPSVNSNPVDSHAHWKRVDSESGSVRCSRNFKPDLILSDFTLPGFDGISALEISRELAPDTPFIFLSGTLGEERAIDALQRGAYDYVLKTNMARLVPAVRRALSDSAIRRGASRARTAAARHRRHLAGLDLGARPQRQVHLLQRFGAHHAGLCAGGNPRPTLRSTFTRRISRRSISPCTRWVRTSARRATFRRAGATATAPIAGSNETCWCCWVMTGR